MKDLFPRYKTMCGFHVERKAGWDTHGLPVEIEVEKSLGLEGKQDIEKYGIAPFIEKCRESVWKYTGEWEKLTERIGFWLDMSKPYITYSPEYVESVWWSLKRIHELGLLYKGWKILPWCPRDMTGLSSHEVGQGYLNVEDPAVTVAFKLTAPVKAGGQTFTGVQALAWTTTPWTLLSNVALVVGPAIDYVVVRRGEATYLLAAARHEAVLGGKNVEKGEVLATVKGAELAGLTYEPLFPYAGAPDTSDRKPAQRVVADGYVTTTDGTGIVHAAPAFGVEDERVCKANGLAFVNLVKPDGKFTDACGPYAGRWVKEADGDIARDLKARGQLVKQERIHHEYPHCWRCKTPLLYYAREAWFIETSRLKERLVALNKTIEWNPEHIRDGRFGDFLENNKDWALSRERYWGTPLPAWECTGCGKHVLVESRAELRKLGADVPDDLDPHRPGIDAVTIPRCGACGGGPLKRVKEVIDCWYDSGAMPYAQWGYPHVEGSKAKFQANFPADFICEAIDQTRGWFYTLHAIATLLFDKPAYKRCLVLGHVLDAQGNKLSKKDKNYKSPDEVMDTHGADAFRWFFYSKMTPGQGVRFIDDTVRDAKRTFLLKLLNVYKFFQEYASADGFDPTAGGTPRPALARREPLDRWIISELNTTTQRVREGLDAYEWTRAAQALETFVDGLSNWYVRRCRPRAWRPPTAEDGSKWAFWWTLYEVQTTLVRLIAPFVPFIADELHGALVRDLDTKSQKSVHLERYPEVDPAVQDPGLEAQMELARRVVDLGSQARRAAKLNLRQPLGSAVILLSSAKQEDALRDLLEVVGDELNVKQTTISREHDRYVKYDVRVDFKRLGPRFGKKLGAVKKALEAMDPKDLAAAAREGRPVELKVDGSTETLASADLDVRLTAREGFVAAHDKGVVVVVDTAVTPTLVREGLAREVTSRIQALRKELDLPYDARVELSISGAEGELLESIREHQAVISRDTSTSTIRFEQADPVGFVLELDPDEASKRYLAPLNAAVQQSFPRKPEAQDEGEGERASFLVKGATGEQQRDLRVYRDLFAGHLGPYVAEFDRANEKFMKQAQVVTLDGPRIATEQRRARFDYAVETYSKDVADPALRLPKEPVVVPSGLSAAIHRELVEGWKVVGSRMVEPRSALDLARKSGKALARKVRIDASDLVLALRVVP